MPLCGRCHCPLFVSPSPALASFSSLILHLPQGSLSFLAPLLRQTPFPTRKVKESGKYSVDVPSTLLPRAAFSNASMRFRVLTHTNRTFHDRPIGPSCVGATVSLLLPLSVSLRSCLLPSCLLVTISERSPFPSVESKPNNTKISSFPGIKQTHPRRLIPVALASFSLSSFLLPLFSFSLHFSSHLQLSSSLNSTLLRPHPTI